MDIQSQQRQVEKYLLQQLGDEIHEFEYHLAYKDVDPYTKWLYWRVREFHWTVSRLLKKIRSTIARMAVFAYFASRGQNAPGARASKSVKLSVAPAPLQTNPRLLLDVTDTAQGHRVTGIQRVVRQIARNAVEMGAGLPVVIENGQLWSYYRHPTLPTKVEIQAGDRFVMLDASWNRLEDYFAVTQEVVEKGGLNIVCVYDIIPLLYPQAFAASLGPLFTKWFETLVSEADAVVAISQSTARELGVYTRRSQCALRAGCRIGWWPLGADFDEAQAEARPSNEVAACVADRPLFLGVGTLEPRKAYPVALDAFEEIWRDGADATYVIIGRKGWNSRHLEARILAHPEYGRRLFWFDAASDADLRYLYRHARAAICASFAEGFGLPIVEAAHYGAPVIASDIPVFREVGGDSATFFAPLNASELAARIHEALSAPRRKPHIDVISWRRSTEELLRLVRDDAYQSTVETLCEDQNKNVPSR